MVSEEVEPHAGCRIVEVPEPSITVTDCVLEYTKHELSWGSSSGGRETEFERRRLWLSWAMELESGLSGLMSLSGTVSHIVHIKGRMREGEIEKENEKKISSCYTYHHVRDRAMSSERHRDW